MTDINNLSKQEIVNLIYQIFQTNDYDERSNLASVIPYIDADTALFVDRDGYSLLDEALYLVPNSYYTRWMLQNVKSLDLKQESIYGGRYVLDAMISHQFENVDMLNEYTFQTLLLTNKLTEPYAYDFEEMQKRPQVENDKTSRLYVLERYFLHHQNFQEYLNNNPKKRMELNNKGVDLSFFLAKYNFDEFKKIYQDAGKKKPTNDNTVKTTTTKTTNANAESFGKTFDVTQAPTIDEYEKNNILQPSLLESLRKFEARQKLNKAAEEMGINAGRKRYHLLFTGNPGTGKTTLARVMGRFYKDLGVLSKGHVVEVSGTDLKAEYIGQTAPKVEEAVENARGGVLFIDEIYNLTQDGGRDFAKDAVDKLLYHMENDSDDLIIIVAGYKDKVEKFLETNAGLRSRFAGEFKFNNFKKDELRLILELRLNQKDFIMSSRAKDVFVDALLKNEQENKTSYANARTLEGLLDAVVDEHALSLFNTDNKETLSEAYKSVSGFKKVLQSIKIEAVRRALPTLKKFDEKTNRSPIGYFQKDVG